MPIIGWKPTDFYRHLTVLAQENNVIDPIAYGDYDAKIGLRHNDGTGVLIGLTEIGEVRAYVTKDGINIPQHGQLFYRGIDLYDLVKGYQQEKRHGFEEVCFLLLFGKLPTIDEMEQFNQYLGERRELPNGFTEDMILKAPSSDIMNKLGRNVLTCYSYDDNPDDIRVQNVTRQCLDLIAKFPTMVAYAYHAKRHFYDHESLFIHKPQEELSTSQNFLHMIRQDNSYSELEAEVLDLSLILHCEHGGGNNSTFTTRVVSSTDTDTYSAISAGVGSLKGPKHGGANIKVIHMIEYIKASISSLNNAGEIEDCLRKIIRKEAFDCTGLIYGMGHAVYTLSDPRAVMLKAKAHELAKEKGMEEEFQLYNLIEEIAPKVFAEVKKDAKLIVPNVDFYSGFVYQMLNIPMELYTPIFAMARIAGWSAHRLEEMVNGGKIIRPAYKNIAKKKEYLPLLERV